MRFENTRVFNFDGAFRGMRNPMNSWDRSDSYFEECTDDFVHTHEVFVLGQNDRTLAQKLIAAGPEHRKFLRQIMVCVDITAPLFW